MGWCAKACFCYQNDFTFAID